MADVTKLYFDQAGFLAKTVFITNEKNYDHTIHDEPGLTGVVVDPLVYQKTDPAIALNGLAFSASLHAAVIPVLSKADPVLAAKVQNIAANPDAATQAKFNALMIAAIAAAATGP